MKFTKWYVYNEEIAGAVVNKYYQTRQPGLDLIGIVYCNADYFLNMDKQIESHAAMYTKRDILKKARECGDKTLVGMLEDYARLRFTYLPQVLRFVVGKFGKKFPHLLKAAYDSKVEKG